MMPLNIRSEHVNQLAERLAGIKRTTKTDAVRIALEGELRRATETVPLRQRLKPLQDRIRAYSPSGDQADKSFFDMLSGDD